MNGKNRAPRERAVGAILVMLRHRGPLTVSEIEEHIPFNMRYVKETLCRMEMEGLVMVVAECKYAPTEAE